MRSLTTRLVARSAARSVRDTFLAALSMLATVGALLTAPICAAVLLDDTLDGTLDADEHGTVVVGDVHFATARPLLALAAALGVLALARALGEFSARRLTARGTAWLRQRALHHLLAPALDSSDHDPDDSLRSLVTDTRAVAHAPVPFLAVVGALLTTAGSLGALALLRWELAVAWLAVAPLAALLATGLTRASRRRAREWTIIGHHPTEADAELSRRLADAIRGLRTIAASGTTDREIQRVLEPLAGGSRPGRARRALTAARTGLPIPVGAVATLVAGGVLLGRDQLTASELVAAGAYGALAVAALRTGPARHRIRLAKAAADRLSSIFEKHPPDAGWSRLSPGPGGLELKDVGVDGPLGKVLDGVNLTVSAGSVVAIVGPPVQRRALAEVAGGIRHPDRGDVLLDGTRLSEVNADSLGDAVGYAFGSPALYGGTVGESIGYGTVATASRVSAAARRADVHDPISRLPDGYRTPVDTLARTPLSRGAMQRLGLARAILRTPRLLVLDDVTATLDDATGKQLADTLATVLPDSTRLIITDRMSTAERADVVVWLHEGSVVAAKPHSELLSAPRYLDAFGSDTATMDFGALRRSASQSELDPAQLDPAQPAGAGQTSGV